MARCICRSIQSKGVVEDLQDIHFSNVVVKGRVVNPYVNGFSSFSGSLFAILAYFLKVGDVGSGMVI